MDYLTASSNSRIPNIVEEMVGDVRIFAREQWGLLMRRDPYVSAMGWDSGSRNHFTPAL